MVDVLLWYPERIKELLAAGAGEVLSHTPAESLPAILLSLDDAQRADSAKVCEAMPTGLLRDLVLERLCARAEPCAPEVEDTLPTEVLQWLKRQNMARRYQNLVKAIARAEAAGRDGEVARLLRELQDLPADGAHTPDHLPDLNK